MSDQYQANDDNPSGDPSMSMALDNAQAGDELNWMEEHATAYPPSLRPDQTVAQAGWPGLGKEGQDAVTDPSKDPKFIALQEQEQKLRAKKLAADKDVSDQMGVMSEQIGNSQPPTMEQQPEAPKDRMQEGMHEWLAVSTMLAALAGSVARGNATTALNAFGSAMQGFAKGKQQQFDTSLEQWKAASTKVVQDNKAKLDNYELILRNKQLSMDMKLAQMKMVAQSWGDQITYNLADQKQYETLAMAHERELDAQVRLAKITQDMQNSAARTQVYLQQAQEREEGINGSVDGILDGTIPPTNANLGTMRDRDIVQSRLRAKTGGQFNLAKAQLAWQAAQKQTLSVNSPQMIRFVGQAKSALASIKSIREDAEQLKLSGVTDLNRARLTTLIRFNANSKEAQIAQDYISKLNFLRSDGAQVESGGYAPIQEAWNVVNKQIDEDMAYKQLGTALNALEMVFNYRLQAIPNFTTAGPLAPNRYTGNKGENLGGEIGNPAGGTGDDGWGQLH